LRKKVVVEIRRVGGGGGMSCRHFYLYNIHSIGHINFEKLKKKRYLCVCVCVCALADLVHVKKGKKEK
jgi:hypothetical protein